MARHIALKESKQTGANATKFLDGTNDDKFGIRTAISALKRGIELGKNETDVVEHSGTR